MPRPPGTPTLVPSMPKPMRPMPKQGERRVLWTPAAALALVSASLLASPVAARAGEIVDGIAAQVGGNIVLISEVDELAEPIAERMRNAGVSNAEIQAMRSDALERLIEARMIEGVVDRLELSATDEEVDAAIAGIAAEAGLTVPQLSRSVAAHGLPYAEYREKIRAELERSKVINSMVRSRVRIEEYEVKALYNERYGDQPTGGRQVHLRHMLVAIGTASMRNQETACGMVAEARDRILRGRSSFQDEAAEISDANPQLGGDLGWIHFDDLAGWMKPHVEALDDGETSEVIETRFGCNLLQVVEKKTYEAKSIEDVRPELENELYQQKTQKEYVKWVDKLREQTYVERKGTFSESARLNPSLSYGNGGGGSGSW